MMIFLMGGVFLMAKISKWYDLNNYPNVRYCGNCFRKVGTNRQNFNFEFCPYCGSNNTISIPISRKELDKLIDNTYLNADKLREAKRRKKNDSKIC